MCRAIQTQGEMRPRPVEVISSTDVVAKCGMGREAVLARSPKGAKGGAEGVKTGPGQGSWPRWPREGAGWEGQRGGGWSVHAEALQRKVAQHRGQENTKKENWRGTSSSVNTGRAADALEASTPGAQGVHCLPESHTDTDADSARSGQGVGCLGPP